MEIIHTPLQGLVVLKPDIFKDERGYFFESYNQPMFMQCGVRETFVQDNQSCSKKGVVRGLHFQNPPYAQAKLVRVIRGAVIDVAVDIRRNSPTYGQHFSVELTGENQMQFFLPAGFAHGFVALEDDTIFAYKCSNFYNKAAEGCILYNDPILAIDWHVAAPIVSEKDLQGTPFALFNSEF